MLLDRKPRGEDPWLTFKVGAFSVGSVFALAGIYFRADWMIWVAIGVLVLGFGARFLGDREKGEEAGADTDRDDAPSDDEERSGLD